MKIAFCCTDTRAQPWLDAFRAALQGSDSGFEIADWFETRSVPFAADYAVVWTPPAELFAQQPQLKAVFNIGAGVDALMKSNALPRHIPVVRLDDAGMSVQMAEYVCHAIIRHFRDLGVYDTAQREAKWAYQKPRRRSDFTVGIMGLGVLGQRVARAVAQFEFPVIGWSASSKHIDGVASFAGQAQFVPFLNQCKVLVCLLPLTPDTAGIINATTLAALPQGAYVINVARGGHVVDTDLLAALDSHHLAGATLDVFHQEPLPPTHAYWAHPRVTVTPHTSARTMRDETVAQIIGKMAAMQRGEPVAGLVNLSKGY
jgi:glyoxylate/hydroxypyruvate reductase